MRPTNMIFEPLRSPFNHLLRTAFTTFKRNGKLLHPQKHLRTINGNRQASCNRQKPSDQLQAN